jgi:hypothetical protein
VANLNGLIIDRGKMKAALEVHAVVL